MSTLTKLLSRKSRRIDSPSSKSATWRDVTLEDMPLVPGMTQVDELRYFYWCCQTLHKPGRRVVELGPWVGRSTMALAAGLRRSDPRAMLTTIDCFQWDSWALANVQDWTIEGLSKEQRKRLTPRDLAPQEGDSFLPIFRAYTEPMRDILDVVDDNLERYEWCGDPIDVIMIDAAKSWDAMDQIVRQFFPSLTDGAAVIHQDYIHYYCYWLHVVTERMIERGVLSVAENVEGLPTQGFRFHAAERFLPEEYLRNAFTDEEADRLLARSARRFKAPNEVLAVVASHYCLLKDQGNHARARRIAHEAMRSGRFVDNYCLADLLTCASDHFQPLTSKIFEDFSKTYRGVHRSYSGDSMSIGLLPEGKSLTLESFPLETAEGTEVVTNFVADRGGDGSLRVRVRASDEQQGRPFFDEEYVCAPGEHLPVIIPVVGRNAISISLTFVVEGTGGPQRMIDVVAPTLLR